MPSYHWMADKKTDFKSLPVKIKRLVQLGVPYDTMDQHVILDDARVQALKIATGLVEIGVQLPEDLNELDSEAEIAEKLSERQVVAIIAYLQKLGAYNEIDPNGDRKAAPALANPDTKHPNTAPVE